MASRPSGPIILEVVFEPREDGGLRAYCDRLPSFVLSHHDPKAVLADVVPALETILSAMYRLPVQVAKADDLAPKAAIEIPAYMCGPARYVGVQAAH